MQVFSKVVSILITALLASCGGGGGGGGGNPNLNPNPTPPQSISWAASIQAGSTCFEGLSGVFPCRNVDLLSIVDFDQTASDLWGWTDPIDGSEYAIIGLLFGTAFVNITDPESPIYVGYVQAATDESNWRDMKVYRDHVYIVSEAEDHGMQVFDLTRLRGVSTTTEFSADTHYGEFGEAHNIVINESTAFAYAVGSDTCNEGLHMIDIDSPKQPQFAGCFGEDGYTHDAQCISYFGPDIDYTGREICFNSNEQRLTLVDVSDKSDPVLLSRSSYPLVGYVHQGWITEDYRYFMQGDETDELDSGLRTTTYVWNIEDLDRPVLQMTYTAATSSIDHNLYVHQGHVYQANYAAGLRVLRIGDLSNNELVEVAYFDAQPGTDAVDFIGAWSVYPYFDSGVVILSDDEHGLVVLRPDLDQVPQCQDGLDNDLDGFVDFPADASCNGAASLSEN